MAKDPCVYILASRPLGTLYIGVTSDLHSRMSEHVQGLRDGFAKRYGVRQLVYYEMHCAVDEAIRREKQLKEWRRLWKIRIIEAMNPEWLNLFGEQSGDIWPGPVEAFRLEHEPITLAERPSVKV